MFLKEITLEFCVAVQMPNTLHFHLSILFVLVTLALFGMSFDLNGNTFFRVIVETDRMLLGNCISSPMRCQC